MKLLTKVLDLLLQQCTATLHIVLVVLVSLILYIQNIQISSKKRKQYPSHSQESRITFKVVDKEVFKAATKKAIKDNKDLIRSLRDR